MNVNLFAQEVHENAVKHGWYDKPPSFPEVAALIHSEISEALEEWRNGSPVIYGCCNIEGAVCPHAEKCDRSENEPSCKPEGLAVELGDAVLRIFDYLAFLNVDIESVLEGKHAYNMSRPYKHGGKKI